MDCVKGKNGGNDVSKDVLSIPATTVQIQLNFPRLKRLIRIISSFCILLGAMAVVIQVATLMIYLALLRTQVKFPIDNVGFGIWGGILYSTAGAFGLVAAHKQTKSLLVIALVMWAISIAASFFAVLFTGIAANAGVYHQYTHTSGQYSEYCSTVDRKATSICYEWQSLEWFLFTLHLLALTSNLIQVALLSLALNCKCICCCTCETVEPVDDNITPSLQVPSAPNYTLPTNNLAVNRFAEKSENLKAMYNGNKRDGINFA